MLSELEDALRNQVVGVPFPIITFECDACGSLVGRNADEFLAGKSAVCLQNDCGAEFLAVTPVGEEIVVKPIQDYPLCTACREPMPIGPRKLSIGAELVCLACGKAHLFVGHNWTYVAK